MVKGFRDGGASVSYAPVLRAGGPKPPRKETRGGWADSLRFYGDFDGGGGWVGGWRWLASLAAELDDGGGEFGGRGWPLTGRILA